MEERMGAALMVDGERSSIDQRKEREQHHLLGEGPQELSRELAWSYLDVHCYVNNEVLIS